MGAAVQARCDALQPADVDEASPFERTVGGWLFWKDFPRVWESEADGAAFAKGRQGDGQGFVASPKSAARTAARSFRVSRENMKGDE